MRRCRVCGEKATASVSVTIGRVPDETGKPKFGPGESLTRWAAYCHSHAQHQYEWLISKLGQDPLDTEKAREA